MSKERRPDSPITPAQYEKLVTSLEKNLQFALSSSKSGKDSKKFWKNLTKTLNTLGPKKGHHEWVKIWKEKSKLVKKKLKNDGRQLRSSPSTSKKSSVLSDVELKIVKMINLKKIMPSQQALFDETVSTISEEEPMEIEQSDDQNFIICVEELVNELLGDTETPLSYKHRELVKKILDGITQEKNFEKELLKIKQEERNFLEQKLKSEKDYRENMLAIQKERLDVVQRLLKSE